MKYNLLFSIAILLALGSCKKNNADLAPTLVKVEIPPVDSTAFKINGKLYTATNIKSSGTQCAPANESVDPITNIVNWKGSADSVTYSRNYSFTDINPGIFTISFVKKYAKADLIRVSTSEFYYPANPFGLFTLGQHHYPIDFERERSQNGVAIATSLGNGGSSYSQKFLGVSTKLNASSQNNSTFNITSLTKLNTGGYRLEATFSVNLFDNNDNLVTRIENGYIRMVL